MIKASVSLLFVIVALMDAATAGILNSTVACNAIGRLDALDVQDCDSLPCVFVKGQRYTIMTRFTPKGNVRNLTITLSARVFLGADLTFLERDVCDYLIGGTTCPLKDGIPQNFKVDFRMSKFFPPLSSKVTANVKDEKGNVQVCAKLPVKIVNQKEN